LNLNVDIYANAGLNPAELGLPLDNSSRTVELANITNAQPSPPLYVTFNANNAYDGRVNVWWDKSAATGFDHYNIYLNKAEMTDITGMEAVQQIKDIATCSYQAAGLEDGTKYYFAVTAADKGGNENKRYGQQKNYGGIRHR